MHGALPAFPAQNPGGRPNLTSRSTTARDHSHSIGPELGKLMSQSTSPWRKPGARRIIAVAGVSAVVLAAAIGPSSASGSTSVSVTATTSVNGVVGAPAFTGEAGTVGITLTNQSLKNLAGYAVVVPKGIGTVSNLGVSNAELEPDQGQLRLPEQLLRPLPGHPEGVVVRPVDRQVDHVELRRHGTRCRHRAVPRPGCREQLLRPGRRRVAAHADDRRRRRHDARVSGLARRWSRASPTPSR